MLKGLKPTPRSCGPWQKRACNGTITVPHGYSISGSGSCQGSRPLRGSQERGLDTSLTPGPFLRHVQQEKDIENIFASGTDTDSFLRKLSGIFQASEVSW